jgi:dolichyldiphosphatase
MMPRLEPGDLPRRPRGVASGCVGPLYHTVAGSDLLRNNSPMAKKAKKKKPPAAAETMDEPEQADGHSAAAAAATTQGGLVERAEALETELNSAGVLEGRMLTRLLNACEVAGSLCLEVGERLETKWVVSSALGSVLLYTGGEPSVVLLVVGGLLNAVMGKCAKVVLAQPRPVGAKKTDNGMPSSHALSLFFFGSYLAVACLRMAVAAATAPKPAGVSTAAEQHDAALSAALQAAQWGVGALVCVFSAMALSWQRVDAGLHTPSQVAVGALIGAVNGAAWARLEVSILPQVVELLPPGGKLGYSGVIALICVSATVVGWSELRRSKRSQSSKSKGG